MIKLELLLKCESLNVIPRYFGFVKKVRDLGMYQPAVSLVSISRRQRTRSSIVVHLFPCISKQILVVMLGAFFLSIAMLRQPHNQHGGTECVMSGIEFGYIAKVYYTRSK